MTSTSDTARMRELNDRLRKTHTGGKVLVTAGINALGPEAVATILREVAVYDSFSADNDPYEEHDCAILTVGGVRILWKIDYYDSSLRFRSPDPTNPAVTTRVMTVMLAEEY